MSRAASGINTKLATSARVTRRALRSGTRICPTVRLKPTASMLDTTNTSNATGTAFARSSIAVS